MVHQHNNKGGPIPLNGRKRAFMSSTSFQLYKLESLTQNCSSAKGRSYHRLGREWICTILRHWGWLEFISNRTVINFSVTDDIRVKSNCSSLAIFHIEKFYIKNFKLLCAEECWRAYLQWTDKLQVLLMMAWSTKSIHEKKKREKKTDLELTGGPSSGGITILLLPPGLMSLIPSSNPESVALYFLLHGSQLKSKKEFDRCGTCLGPMIYSRVEF